MATHSEMLSVGYLAVILKNKHKCKGQCVEKSFLQMCIVPLLIIDILGSIVLSLNAKRQ